MPSLCHLESSHGHRPTASLLTPSSACPAQQFVKQNDQSRATRRIARASVSTSQACALQLGRAGAHHRRRIAARPRRASPQPLRSAARRLRIGVRRGTPGPVLRPLHRPLRLVLWLRPGVRRRTPPVVLEPLVQVRLTIKYTSPVLEIRRPLARHAIPLKRARTEPDVQRGLLSGHQIIAFRHAGSPPPVRSGIELLPRCAEGGRRTASGGRRPRPPPVVLRDTTAGHRAVRGDDGRTPQQTQACVATVR